MLEGQARLSREVVPRFRTLLRLWGKKGGAHTGRGDPVSSAMSVISHWGSLPKRPLWHLHGWAWGWDEALPCPEEGTCLVHTSPSRGHLAAARSASPPTVPSHRPAAVSAPPIHFLCFLPRL